MGVTSSDADVGPAGAASFADREDLPPGEQPGRRGPVSPAVRKQFPAEAYYWPHWTLVLPCSAAFAAGLIVASSLVSQPTNGFELARSAVAWSQADRAGQVVARTCPTSMPPIRCPGALV
jgi:hypothetical protein